MPLEMLPVNLKNVGVEGFEPKTLPIASGGSEPAFKIAYKKGKKNQLRISPDFINFL
jgi:hypothetical protein